MRQFIATVETIAEGNTSAYDVVVQTRGQSTKKCMDSCHKFAEVEDSEKIGGFVFLLLMI